MNSLTVEQIQEIIPHRQPMLLIDTVEELEPGKRAVAKKCVSYNEPYFAGILYPDATKKPAYFALDDLINREWKTSLELKPDENGTVKFRGFKGKYKIVWRDTSGNIRTKIVSVR